VAGLQYRQVNLDELDRVGRQQGDDFLVLVAEFGQEKPADLFSRLPQLPPADCLSFKKNRRLGRF